MPNDWYVKERLKSMRELKRPSLGSSPKPRQEDRGKDQTRKTNGSTKASRDKSKSTS